MKKIISTVALLLLVVPAFSQNALSAEETDTRFPFQSTITRGTAAGTVGAMAGIDASYYSVAEEDTNANRDFDNTTINPSGIGTHNDFTAVGCIGGNFNCVDEGPPSPGDENITYVSEDFLGGNEWSNDTYAAQDFTFPAGHDVIDEVRVYGTARNEFLIGPPEGNFYAVCVYSGITLDCDTAAWTTYVYTEYSNTWLLNPDDAGAWEDADIDALEIGHQAQWQDPGPGPDSWATLVYAIVQSNGPLYDYTLDFTLDFQGIEYSDEPKLVVTGYRGGDAETITLQILRGGVWTTLSANAFGAASATVSYDLSKLDVAGGSAAVRIVDNDATDDTQSTVYIDEMKIITTGEASDPAAPIDVYVHLSYDLWGNKIIVEVTWTQTGGREDGVETGKWAILTADGVEMGSYQVNSKLTVDAPWPWFDGNDHIVNATGVVNVVFPDWGHNQTYFSDPDTMHVSNFPRWAIMLILVFIVCAIIAIFAISALKRAKEYREYEERKD